MRSRFIKLSELSVNTKNFRHHGVETEKEAIKLNIDEDIDSFKELILSISSDIRGIIFVLLVDENNNFKVMDANRRLSIFRMIQDNSLIPEGHKYNEIKTLILGMDLSLPEEVFCDIYEDTEDEKRLLMIRLEDIHLRDDKTKKDWNALSQYRASLEIGSEIQYPWIKTLLFYEGEDNDETIKSYLPNNIDVFNKTLNRKQQLNIEESGKIGHDNDRSIYEDIISLVTNRLFKSAQGKEVKINTRTPLENIQEYIDEIIAVHNKSAIDLEDNPKLPEQNEPSKSDIREPYSDESEDKNTLNVPNQISTPRDIFNNCKTIIPRKHKIRSSNHRINTIIRELRTLDVDNFPNACGLLLRILFELSAKHYLEINSDYNNSEEKNFEKVLKDAREHLYNRGKLTKSEKSHLQSDQNYLNQLFNGYAHNTNAYPSTEALKGYFKSHQVFLLGCLEI